MYHFRNVFSKLFKKDKLSLGRWNINYNQKYLDNKIYLANHDHCGPCGSLQNISEKKQIKVKANK